MSLFLLSQQSLIVLLVSEPEVVQQQLLDRLMLMPELCTLYGLTWDMAVYGVSLRYVALCKKRVIEERTPSSSFSL
jgi:hypothetical protein